MCVQHVFKYFPLLLLSFLLISIFVKIKNSNYNNKNKNLSHFLWSFLAKHNHWQSTKFSIFLSLAHYSSPFLLIFIFVKIKNSNYNNKNKNLSHLLWSFLAKHNHWQSTKFSIFLSLAHYSSPFLLISIFVKIKNSNYNNKNKNLSHFLWSFLAKRNHWQATKLTVTVICKLFRTVCLKLQVCVRCL